VKLHYKKSLHSFAKIFLSLALIPFVASSDFTPVESLKSSQSYLARDPLYQGEFSFKRFSGAKRILAASGNIARLYLPKIVGNPAIFEEGDMQKSNSVYYRERVFFASPTVLNKYGFLTFSVIGELSDRLWVESNLLPKARLMPLKIGSMARALPILNSQASLEDFFTFSGDIDEFNILSATVEESLVVDLLFTEYSNTLTLEDGCLSAKSGTSRPPLKWSFATFKGMTSPLPIVQKERSLIRLELTPKVRGFPYAKLIIYLDKKNNLPLRKEVIGENGEEIKVILSAFADGNYTSELKGEEEQAIFKQPIPVVTLVYESVGLEASELKVTIIEYLKNKWCSLQYPEGLDAIKDALIRLQPS
jgi:hypothetical protein